MYPRGIRNIGNTCYINTIIQCLGYCHAFLRLMFNDENAIVKNEKSLLWQLCTLYKDSCSNEVISTAINPVNLIKVLHSKMHVYLNVFEQNDINEFLTILLDKLNDEISRPYDERHKSYDATSLFDIQRRRMDSSWELHHKKNYSELVPMFYGQMISQIICGNCKAIHHNHEVMMNIMVSVNPDKNESLQKILDNFFLDELVDETWSCDKCKRSHKSTRSHRLWRVPNILIITVKRFTKTLEKINTSIDVPVYLDISKHTIPPCAKYVLRSVACHSGSGFNFGGHYHAIGFDDNKWTIMDDEVIARTEDIPMGVDKGYIFFYESLRSKKA